MHAIQQNVDKRLDDMQWVPLGLSIISSTINAARRVCMQDIKSQLYTFQAAKPDPPAAKLSNRKPRARSVAARIHKATCGEDFSEALAGVTSDNEEGAQHQSARPSPSSNFAPRGVDEEAEKQYLKILGVGCLHRYVVHLSLMVLRPNLRRHMSVSISMKR